MCVCNYIYIVYLFILDLYYLILAACGGSKAQKGETGIFDVGSEGEKTGGCGEQQPHRAFLHSAAPVRHTSGPKGRNPPPPPPHTHTTRWLNTGSTYIFSSSSPPSGSVVQSSRETEPEGSWWIL